MYVRMYVCMYVCVYVSFIQGSSHAGRGSVTGARCTD